MTEVVREGEETPPNTSMMDPGRHFKFSSSLDLIIAQEVFEAKLQLEPHG